MSTPQIPDHLLLRPIGRGAYGEVWLARNVMGTPRAVKIVWRRQFESDRPYEREFAGIQRYEPVSRCADGLVHLLHVGRNNVDGYFYYVMELADAAVPPTDEHSAAAVATPPGNPWPATGYLPRTLRSDLKQLGRLPVADCLRVALDVVGGLARLHERGLVHRDVKPGNIIFVEGRAKLADIGLVSKGSEGRTFVGTEGYIPPEGPGLPGADIYALGMVLYEAITGYSPDRFPRVPSEWFAPESSSEALEFHAVVLRACEGSKERRYQTAEEMQADLALLQSGQSVRNLRALGERVARWRRVGWMAAASVAMAITTALIAHWRAQVAAETQAKETRILEQAKNSLARAENAEHESRLQLYTALLEQARATVRSGEMGQRVRALDAIRRAAAISNSIDLRREAVAALLLPDLQFQRELAFGPEHTLEQLDPAFERVAVSRRRGPIEIYSTSDNHLLATLPASTNLFCYTALWRDDGRFLAANRDYDSRGSHSDLEVWDLKDSPRRALLIRDARWKARAFHPQQPRILVGGNDGLLMAWDLETGQELERGKFDATPQFLAYSPDGKTVVATYERAGGWGASIHQAVGGALICSNVFSVRPVSVSWSPAGTSVVLSDDGGMIHVMDSRTGRTRLLGRHKAEAVNTTFNADGRHLISGAWGRELICWDVARMQRAFSIDVDSYVAQFRHDGQACAIFVESGIRLHSFERPRFHRELPEELAPRVRHAAFSPDGRWLAASSDERCAVWDLSSSGPAAVADYAADARLFWAANGELFASRSRINDCFRWRVQASTSSRSPPVLERLPILKPQRFSSLSVMSNLVAWTSAAGSRIGDQANVITNEDGWSLTVQGINGISPDGRWLGIYGAYTPNISVYRLPEFEEVARLTCKARISGFSFSPSGDELAVASNGQVEFWSTKDWQRARAATNFVGLAGVGSLFQSDGRAIWLAKNARSAGLFSATDFAPLLPLPNGLFPLALSADGRQLAVSADGRWIQIWNLDALREELRTLGLGW